MRPVLVVVIAVLVLGGVKLFIDSDLPREPGSVDPVAAVESATSYDVELTLSFDTGPDEFGLEDIAEAPSLLLQLNGKPILKRTSSLAATASPLTVKNVEGVVVGGNEFFVQASPTGDTSAPRALRIRVLQQETVVADKTIWPEFGGMVQGTVMMEVSK